MATSLKHKKTGLQLLKGARIEHYNNHLVKKFQEHDITNAVIFKVEKLQQHVETAGDFSKGLISYLAELNNSLNKITDNDDLKLYAFQIFAELGGLVYPNAGACYSLLPKDLKEIVWKKSLEKFNTKISKSENSNLLPTLNVFLNDNYSQTLTCLVAICLANEITKAIKKPAVIQNSLLNENIKPKATEMPQQFTASSWVGNLSVCLKNHLFGIAPELTDEVKKLIEIYCLELAKEITEVLVNTDLFSSNNTVEWSANKEKNIETTGYFIWNGSNLLRLPKTLVLPMVVPPVDWVRTYHGKAESGGFLLSEFTNVSYQGFLDKKSFQLHQHNLHLNTVTNLNNLQKCKFAINTRMVDFVVKFGNELTESEKLLITDKWLEPNKDLVLNVNKKWAKIFNSATEVRRSIYKELAANKQQTMRNQEMLRIAKLYSDKTIYWPAVFDFRGRVYRIGNLNIQMDEFVRSLISFQSTKRPTNRKKNKHTLEKFNLLLQAILEYDDALIQEWDAIFGDRFINNDAFEKRLLDSIKENKLSLIQVGQLLLVREGHYDKVGVFYDASASAYQIMGMLNLDIGLCELTNVIGNSGNCQKLNKKKDIYEFFTKELLQQLSKPLPFQLNKDKELNQFSEDYLTQNLDRKLLKTIVMPLIYGKTSYGFAEDLENFFAKNHLYPVNSALLKLANLIITKLKTHPYLIQSNSLMTCLQSFGKIMFNLEKVAIVGPYNVSNTHYIQLETAQISIYKKKNKRLSRQKISLTKQKRSLSGEPVPSKRKTIAAFVANYVHYLDGLVCQFIIEQFCSKNTIDIGTIHDCFYIKPEYKVRLQQTYKAGLLMAVFVNQLNYTKWMYTIMQTFEVPPTKELEERLQFLEVTIEKFRKQKYDYVMSLSEFRHDNYLLTNDYLIAAAESVKEVTDAKTKANLNNIIDYLKSRTNNYESIWNQLQQKEGALFPDNK